MRGFIQYVYILLFFVYAVIKIKIKKNQESAEMWQCTYKTNIFYVFGNGYSFKRGSSVRMVLTSVLRISYLPTFGFVVNGKELAM